MHIYTMNILDKGIEKDPKYKSEGCGSTGVFSPGGPESPLCQLLCPSYLLHSDHSSYFCCDSCHPLLPPPPAAPSDRVPCSSCLEHLPQISQLSLSGGLLRLSPLSCAISVTSRILEISPESHISKAFICS